MAPWGAPGRLPGGGDAHLTVPFFFPFLLLPRASLAGAHLALWLLSHPSSLLAGPSQPHRFALLPGLLPLAGKPLIKSVGRVPPGCLPQDAVPAGVAAVRRGWSREGQEGSWAVLNALWAPCRDPLRDAACPGLGVLPWWALVGGTVLGGQVTEPRAAGRAPLPLRGCLSRGQSPVPQLSPLGNGGTWLPCSESSCVDGSG